MKWKEFLKPDFKKITLMFIFYLLSTWYWGLILFLNPVNIPGIYKDVLDLIRTLFNPFTKTIFVERYLPKIGFDSSLFLDLAWNYLLSSIVIFIYTSFKYRRVQELKEGTKKFYLKLERFTIDFNPTFAKLFFLIFLLSFGKGVVEYKEGSFLNSQLATTILSISSVFHPSDFISGLGRFNDYFSIVLDSIWIYLLISILSIFLFRKKK